MKTMIQAVVLFILILMITITSIGFVSHNTLKTELTSAVSNGVEQTVNTMLIYGAYPYSSSDEIIADVLQNIIVFKSSKGPLIVNIYNKTDLAYGILEVEAIEPYSGLGSINREASYRVRAQAYHTLTGSQIKSYFKYTDPSSATTPSETWTFSAEDIASIKSYLETSEGAFPSSERNDVFLARFSHLRTINS